MCNKEEEGIKKSEYFFKNFIQYITPRKNHILFENNTQSYIENLCNFNRDIYKMLIISDLSDESLIIKD